MAFFQLLKSNVGPGRDPGVSNGRPGVMGSGGDQGRCCNAFPGARARQLAQPGVLGAAAGTFLHHIIILII